MEVIKGAVTNIKGIPPSGLCVGVHRAGLMHQRMLEKHGDKVKVWSLRPEIEFLAYANEDLEAKGLRATGDLDAFKDRKLIFGTRGAPPQVRKQAQEKGLEIVADATCPFVIQQEEAAEELLAEGFNLVMLSNAAHHGIPRIQGIAKDAGREMFIVEREEDVDKIRLTRFEPVGVLVQTTFWMESYKNIMVLILDRFANVRVRNTACIDSLQRLPEVASLARSVDAVVIVGWNDGMTNRMLETARELNPSVYKLAKVELLEKEWLQGKERIGVIGSNETPDWMVDQVIDRIKALAA